MKNFLHNGRQALLVTIVLLLICGLLFPLLLTGLSKVFFPSQAAGSLVTVDGQVVGAKNVGQEFTEDYYLWGRPSAYHIPPRSQILIMIIFGYSYLSKL